MAAAPFVGFVLEPISGIDGESDSFRRSLGGVSDAISKDGSLIASLYVIHGPGGFLLAAAGDKAIGEGDEKGEKESVHPVGID